MYRKHVALVLLAGVVVCSSAMVDASVILSPTSVVNNTFGELHSSFAVTNLINQSGLSTGFVSGVTDFDAYLAGSPTHANPSFSSGGGFASQSNNVNTGTIDFDLGSIYTLHRFALWNDQDIQALGNFTLEVSNDPGFATATSLGSFSGVVDIPPIVAQVFDLSDASGRYVRLHATTVAPATNLINFGEIAFDATAGAANGVVPEPGQLLIWSLLAACGGLGVILRRRG
jgi:hypothetical protein